MAYVATEVNQCLLRFFERQSEQIGFPSPAKVQADECTNYHRTRQFTSLITVVPDLTKIIIQTFGPSSTKKYDGLRISH